MCIRDRASEELQKQLQASDQTAELVPFEGGHGIDESVLPELTRFIAAHIEG